METTENKIRYNENVNIKTGRVGFVDFVNCRGDKRIAKVALYITEITGAKNASGEYPTKKSCYRITIFEGGKNIIPFEKIEKGAVIRCVGRDDIREYTDKHGEKAYSHDIVAYEVSLIAPPKAAEGEATSSPSESAPAAEAQAPAQASAAPANDMEEAFAPGNDKGNEIWDDDFFNR